MTHAEIMQFFERLQFIRDDRLPPDDPRRSQFRTGWGDSAVRHEEYRPAALRNLTWCNLGYRFGKEYGPRPVEEIDTVYEHLARQYDVARAGDQAAASDQPTFEIGRVYSRRADIHARYGGQQQGGISTPARFRCVFLFTGPTGEQHGYRDGWNDDGVFLYTGEGQLGDMQFVRGNLKIRDHAADGRDLHLFEALASGEGYRYLGCFDCVGWEYRRGPDRAGQDRQVIVFQLLPESGAETALAPSDEQVPAATLDELRDRALAAVRPPAERSPREARRLYHERSALVRQYVLARADGICESCRRPAPFVRAGGTPYLEPHHTRRMADGGPDHPRWVGAVCPNCHREVHHGEHGQEVNRRLVEYLHSIEPDNPG
jgi:5-methylcytosine-specific restriction protein A